MDRGEDSANEAGPWGISLRKIFTAMAGTAVALVYAVASAIAVHLWWDDADDLFYGPGVEIALTGLAVAFALSGGVSVLMLGIKNRTLHAQLVALRSQHRRVVNQNVALRDLGSAASRYRWEAFCLRLAGRDGLLVISALTEMSKRATDLCLDIPAKTMARVIGGHVALSIWIEEGTQLRMVSGPQHRATVQGASVPKLKSWIYLKPMGVPQQPEALTTQDIKRLYEHDPADESDDALDLLEPIDDLTASERYADLDLFYDLGYRSLRALPLNVEGQMAWIIAACVVPGGLRAIEEDYLRNIAVEIETAVMKAPTAPRPRRWRGQMN